MNIRGCCGCLGPLVFRTVRAAHLRSRWTPARRTSGPGHSQLLLNTDRCRWSFASCQQPLHGRPRAGALEGDLGVNGVAPLKADWSGCGLCVGRVAPQHCGQNQVQPSLTLRPLSTPNPQPFPEETVPVPAGVPGNGRRGRVGITPTFPLIVFTTPA